MNGRLPSWVAERLGTHLPSAADGAAWHLDASWNLAPWATLLLIAAAIVWTVALYSRESGGGRRPYRALLIGLRLVAFGALLIMLAQWVIVLRITGRPPVVIMLDRSASMGLTDQGSESTAATKVAAQLAADELTDSTRLSQAKSLLTGASSRWLAELARRFRTELFFVADSLERAPSSIDVAQLSRTIRAQTPHGEDRGATRLGDHLKQLLAEMRDAPPAAVILLSDGVSTRGVPLADAAEDARRMGVPLFAVGLGSESPPRDIELADVLVDDVVFANEAVVLQVQVEASGLAGQAAKVTLRREGQAGPVAEQSLTLPADGRSAIVHLIDRPTNSGELKYVIDVDQRSDEINQQNNRRQTTIIVREDKIRVLLAYGYPSFEFRYLKTLMERDPTIKLATYLQDADPDHPDQDKTALRGFRLNRAELFQYDVVLVGDLDPRTLPSSVWPELRAFVAEKGGGAAFQAGPRNLPRLYHDNTDVAALLPIDVGSLPAETSRSDEVGGSFVVRPTPVGLQNAAFQLGGSPAESERVWARLAPLYWQYIAARLKPGAQVLAEGLAIEPRGHAPAICFQFLGAGRVAFFAIDSTWRWRIGAGDTHFARFWLQMVRFLARGKLRSGDAATLMTDRREYRQGDSVQLRARFLDPRQTPAGGPVVVAIEATGQQRRRVTLNRSLVVDSVFEGTAPDLPAGQYAALLIEPQSAGAPPTARFSVLTPPDELARPVMDAAALSAAAKITHGKFYTIADADRLLDELPDRSPVPIEHLPPIPLWNRWWLLSVFLSCLILEWLLRKRMGLA